MSSGCVTAGDEENTVSACSSKLSDLSETFLRLHALNACRICCRADEDEVVVCDTSVVDTVAFLNECLLLRWRVDKEDICIALLCRGDCLTSSLRGEQ